MGSKREERRGNLSREKGKETLICSSMELLDAFNTETASRGGPGPSYQIYVITEKKEKKKGKLRITSSSPNTCFLSFSSEYFSLMLSMTTKFLQLATLGLKDSKRRERVDDRSSMRHASDPLDVV